MNSDNDDDLLRQALPYDQDNADEFDLTDIPMTGAQYLRQVKLEAGNVPAVTVANLDRNTFKKQNVIGLGHNPKLHKAPAGFAPSERWQMEQVANFSDTRVKLSRHKAIIKKQKKKPPVRLPNIEKVEDWCQLCFGRLKPKSPEEATTNELFSEKNSPTFQEGDGDSSDEQSANSEAIAAKVRLLAKGDPGTEADGTPPLLSIIAFMDQTTVVQVLQYHINWFEATGFSQNQGRWFYALMSCLEKPLYPDTCSMLRTLARNCASLRAVLEGPEDPLLPALNLIICLVARYFDQKDLADTS